MTFLRNHVGQVVSIDFFTVPTIQLGVLFVLIVLAHDRRRILHFNVTQHPTAVWAAQQIIEAFPEDRAGRFMVRDRDGIYGDSFRSRVEGMGIEEILIAPRSPWQNCYVERLIGSVRRECLNHVIVFNDNHLRRLLKDYFRYYHESRTHLSLNKDAPECRAVQSNKSERIIQIPQVGGLHHRYERRIDNRGNRRNSIVSLRRLNDCFWPSLQKNRPTWCGKDALENPTLRLPTSSSAHQGGH
jgi:hypothetical protein